jgi:integrase
MASTDPTDGTPRPARRKHRRRGADAGTLRREIALGAQQRHGTLTGGRRYEPVVEHPPAEWCELRDRRGYRQPQHTTSAARRGTEPGNKGRRYPPNPPTIGESVKFLRACEDTVHGRRRRALYLTLWRTGIRINEALHLLPSDLDEIQGSIVVRFGKGSKGSGPRRRVVGLDVWGWQQLRPWLAERGEYPAGPLFPVLSGPTAGTEAWQYACVDREFKRTARRAGIDKRMALHQIRRAFATERDREGVDIKVIQQQLGHHSPVMTYRYISEMRTHEVLDEARFRPMPTIAVPEVMDMLMPPTPRIGER